MKRTARTQWFPTSTPPVRDGFYEVWYADMNSPSRILKLFKGGTWYMPGSGWHHSSFGWEEGDRWRGLLSGEITWPKPSERWGEL